MRFNTSTWQELEYKYRVKFGLCLIYRLLAPSQVGFKHFTLLALSWGFSLKLRF